MALLACGVAARAQTYRLEHAGDSLSWLVLATDSTTDRWRLPYPTYRLQVGDVDGDGRTEALVGVVKATRYDPTVARRLFIFKNVRGHIRPLWMGSRLGGMLIDFRLVGRKVRTLQQGAHGHYAVADYRLADFGLSFVEFLAFDVGKDEALRVFNND